MQMNDAPILLRHVAEADEILGYAAVQRKLVQVLAHRDARIEELEAEVARLRECLAQAMRDFEAYEAANDRSHRDYHNREEWESEQWERVEQAANKLRDTLSNTSRT